MQTTERAVYIFSQVVLSSSKWREVLVSLVVVYIFKSSDDNAFFCSLLSFFFGFLLSIIITIMRYYVDRYIYAHVHWHYQKEQDEDGNKGNKINKKQFIKAFFISTSAVMHSASGKLTWMGAFREETYKTAFYYSHSMFLYGDVFGNKKKDFLVWMLFF